MLQFQKAGFEGQPVNRRGEVGPREWCSSMTSLWDHLGWARRVLLDRPRHLTIILCLSRNYTRLFPNQKSNPNLNLTIFPCQTAQSTQIASRRVSPAQPPPSAMHLTTIPNLTVVFGEHEPSQNTLAYMRNMSFYTCVVDITAILDPSQL